MNPNGPEVLAAVESSPVAGIEIGGGAAFTIWAVDAITSAKTVSRKVLRVIIFVPLSFQSRRAKGRIPGGTNVNENDSRS